MRFAEELAAMWDKAAKGAVENYQAAKAAEVNREESSEEALKKAGKKVRQRKAAKTTPQSPKATAGGESSQSDERSRPGVPLTQGSLETAAESAQESAGGAKETAPGDETGSGTVEYEIRRIEKDGVDYGIGVYLDTNIFDGRKPRNWADRLKKFVYKNLAGKELTIFDDNGNSETISFAKENDRVKKDGAKNDHKVIDKLAKNRGDNIKALAVVHISEMLETSAHENFTKEHIHQWMDENGWEIRKTYIQDKNGKVHEASLNIANGRDRRILYDINNIREIKNEARDADVPSNAQVQKGLGRNSNLAKTLLQVSGIVNTESFDDDITERSTRRGNKEAALAAETAAIQGIGRKSINSLSSEEIKKTETLAKRYWQQLVVKSPFFRAWFGDRRAHDNNTIEYVPVNSDFIKNGDIPRGQFLNDDTGWNIASTRDGIDETKNKRGTSSDEHRALKDINAILENAVLLDSVIVNEPSKRMGKSSVIVHHLYCPISTGGRKAIAKIYISENLNGDHKFYLTKIEEMSTAMVSRSKEASFNPHALSATGDISSEIKIAEIFDFVKKNDPNNDSNTAKRAYKLLNIEKVPAASARVQGNAPSSVTSTAGTIKNVSDLFAAVKQRDANFNPKPVDPALLNADGTPKVFYPGTEADFTVYDRNKSKRGFFFVDEKRRQSVASRYSQGKPGGIKASYLQIRNPLILVRLKQQKQSGYCI